VGLVVETGVQNPGARSTWTFTRENPDGTLQPGVVIDSEGNLTAPGQFATAAPTGQPQLGQGSAGISTSTVRSDHRHPSERYSHVDHGFAAWNGDPAWLSGQSLSAAVAGTVYLMKVPLAANATVSNLFLYVTTAGVGLTANQCLAGIYSSAGVLLQTTGDQSGVWNSGGLKTMPITAQALTGDFFYFAYMQNFGTSAARFHSGLNGLTVVNANLSAANARFATDSTNTGRTTSLPANLGTLALSSQSPWCAAA